MNIKILIIEDEHKIADVLNSYLVKEGYTVFLKSTAHEGLKCFYEENPDLIILDLMLPDLDGEDVCKKIRKLSNIPILILTAKVDECDVLNGFSIGADDYVTKPFSPKQVVARVNALLRRYKQLENDNSIIKYLDIKVDEKTYEVIADNKKVHLTPTEYKLFMCFIKNPKKVFTREELINNIFDFSFDGYDRVIDTHIKNIRHKLGPNGSNYIKTVHGVGYRLGGIEIND